MSFESQLSRLRTPRRPVGGFWRLLAVAVALVACGDVSSNGATRDGELGSGKFRYECIRSQDAACRGSTYASSFPTAIAVGGAFRVSFLSNSDSSGSYDVTSASSAIVQATSAGFKAVAAGKVSLTAKNSAGSTADTIELLVRSPSKLRIAKEDDAPAQVKLPKGTTQTLWATPVDAEGADLAGVVTCKWSTSDGKVVALLTDAEASSMKVLGASPGKATLTVELPDDPTKPKAILEVEVY